jgi:hypothetical protein
MYEGGLIILSVGYFLVDQKAPIYPCSSSITLAIDAAVELGAPIITNVDP